MRAKNTSKLWDALWNNKSLTQVTSDVFYSEQHSVRWKRIKQTAENQFGGIKNLRIVELGAGLGTYAALFAAEGAKVTVVDYSPVALDLAKKFFRTLGFEAKFVLADIFSLPLSLLNNFDISVSCGVAEHFLGDKRKIILEQHFNVLKPAGVSFLMVPNAANIPYRIYKGLTERVGLWPWGEEYPFKRVEFERFARRKSLTHFGFFGDSFLWSLNYFNPLCLLPKKGFGFIRHLIPQTIETSLDERYAYSLGFWGKKK